MQPWNSPLHRKMFIFFKTSSLQLCLLSAVAPQPSDAFKKHPGLA
jgi:hypothetical protein